MIKCVVACHNANGEPDLFFVIVRVTPEQIENGDHYEEAKKAAEEDGFEGPFVVFDENDPPKPLFHLFHWESASIVDC